MLPRYTAFLSILMFIHFACGLTESQENKARHVVIEKSNMPLLQRMQGRWLDRNMEEAVIEVNGDKMLWVFQEQVMAEKRIEVFEELPKICLGKAEGEAVGFFVAYDGSEGYCYQLIELGDNQFDYAPIGRVK